MNRIISGMYITVPRIDNCVVCCAIIADDAPATKTHSTASAALSISLSPFCSIKSYMLYLELIVRVCNDNSASLNGREDRFFGIFTDPYNAEAEDDDCSACSRTLFAADRVRHDSSLLSFSISSLPIPPSLLPPLLLVAAKAMLLLLDGGSTRLVIDNVVVVEKPREKS